MSAHDAAREARRRRGDRREDYFGGGSDWYWEMNEDFVITFVSEEARRHEFAPENLVGRTRWQFAGVADPAGHPDWRTHLADLTERRAFRDFVYEAPLSGGGRAWVDVAGVPIRSDDGRFMGYRGTSRDVTKRVEAEAALRRRTAQLELARRLGGIGYWEHDLVAGTYEWSPEHWVMVGRDPATFRLDGRSLLEPVHPDDLPGLLAILDATPAGGTFSMRYRVVRPDGEVRFAASEGRVERDSAGTLLRLFGISRDITDEVRALEAAEARGRENAAYRAVFEVLPDQVYFKDVDCRFVVANAATARLIGIDDPSRLIGRTDLELLDPITAQRFYDDEQRFLAAGQQAYLEQPISRADGTEAWLGVLKVPVRDEAGAIVGLVGHGRDITDGIRRAAELVEAQRAAEAASQAKSAFLATMSHEIRSPMTAVLGMADLLAAEALSPQQRRYVDAVRSSGRHLLAIINDVLDFSRIEAGGLELEQIDFRVADVLNEVQSLTAPMARERGLRLDLNADAAAPLVVRGDPTRLKQVLINLVGNGLKFTKEGRVALSIATQLVDEAGVRMRFEVEDTGIGIPEVQQERLFTAFTQAEAATTRRYGGSGLGLAICKRLVEAMGGSIGVESRVGQGSVFWFELPFAVGHAAAVSGRSTFDLASVPPLRILAADDIDLNQDLLREMLGRHGHEVTIAVNGAEAVVLAAQRDFDLVLMDVQMPVMDGLDAARRIRQLPAPASAVPVIALTASVTEIERHRCLSAGMNRVLAKPIDWPELFSAMEGLTSGSPRERDAPAQREASSGPQAPLLDPVVIAAFGQGMTPEVRTHLLHGAVVRAGRAHAELVDLLDDPDQARARARRLADMAVSFGLLRIAELAGKLDNLVGWAADAPGIVRRLGTAVKDTQVEVAVAYPRPGEPAGRPLPA